MSISYESRNCLDLHLTTWKREREELYAYNTGSSVLARLLSCNGNPKIRPGIKTLLSPEIMMKLSKQSFELFFQIQKFILVIHYEQTNHWNKSRTRRMYQQTLYQNFELYSNSIQPQKWILAIRFNIFTIWNTIYPSCGYKLCSCSCKMTLV